VGFESSRNNCNNNAKIREKWQDKRIFMGVQLFEAPQCETN
jgi:hypothetical protein